MCKYLYWNRKALTIFDLRGSHLLERQEKRLKPLKIYQGYHLGKLILYESKQTHKVVKLLKKQKNFVFNMKSSYI